MSMTAAQRRRRDRMRKVVELRAKGFSLRAIAAHLGISPETVRQDLKTSSSAVQNWTPAVQSQAPKLDSNVIPLNRRAAS